jgi:hypothetical protein
LLLGVRRNVTQHQPVRVIYMKNAEVWRQLFAAQQLEGRRVKKTVRAAARELRAAASDFMFGAPDVEFEVDRPPRGSRSRA